MNKLLITAVLSLAFIGCGPALAPDTASESGLLSISVSGRQQVSIGSFADIQQYVQQNNYMGSGRANAGERIAFSASYGSNGEEAGQAYGRVAGSGRYSQEGNPTNQLLLAPGKAFDNGSSGESLWNQNDYIALINHVAMGTTPSFSLTGASGNFYDSVSAAVVDFNGGTAGQNFGESQALELTYTKRNRGSTSKFTVYYGKGKGPVAIKFTEDGAVGGSYQWFRQAGGSSSGNSPQVTMPQSRPATDTDLGSAQAQYNDWG